METQQRELSYWEIDALRGPWDFAIVGAGVTGLHAGIELKRMQPGLKVLILENRNLGAVASTRNAGFLCLGSPSEIQADLTKLGETALIEVLSAKWAGIQRTLRMLGGKAIGLRHGQGYELMARDHSQFSRAIPHLDSVLSDLPLFNQLLEQASANPLPFSSKRRSKGYSHHKPLPAPYYGNWKPLGQISSESSSPWGPDAAGLIPIAWEGQVHPFVLRESLIRYARNLGIRIQEGLQVLPAGARRLSIAPASNYRIERFSLSTNLLDIRSNCIIYASNALTNRLLPDLSPEIIPQRGQMWVSSPLNPADRLRLRGNYHADRGYLYYRTHAGRLLLGGGRNQDLASEQTDEWSENKLISDYLKAYSVEVLGLPGDMTWEMRWSGTMGFTQTGIPQCRQWSDGEWLVAGMNGMGMALGPEMGRRVAHMALESA